jgi:hypothetical protein
MEFAVLKPEELALACINISLKYVKRHHIKKLMESRKISANQVAIFANQNCDDQAERQGYLGIRGLHRSFRMQYLDNYQIKNKIKALTKKVINRYTTYLEISPALKNLVKDYPQFFQDSEINLFN